MSGERVSSLGDNGPASGVHMPGDTPVPPAPQAPVDLRVVALTPDRTHLVLEDSAGAQFRVPVDERLVAALRRSTPTDRARIGQLEIALESQLSPREIQARIRAGHSVEEVSLAAGISAERVERYAVPVIAERQHVVEQAQRAPGRRASGGSAPALLDLVQARLAEQKAAADAVEWDAWRTDDHDRWTVRLAYLAGTRARTATWTFDPRGRVLSAADEEARWLVDESRAERDDDDAPVAVRRLASVPGTAEEPAGAPVTDEVYDREADEAAQSLEGDRAPGPDGAPAAAAARSGRRPAVPSFADIMFGPRRRD